MVVFTAGYLALSAAKIAHHQMWRDELQPWSLARSSSSLGQLISRVRYEQHSPGWYVLLWVVSRFTSSPEAVQVLLFVLVVVTTYLPGRKREMERNARIPFDDDR